MKKKKKNHNALIFLVYDQNYSMGILYLLIYIELYDSFSGYGSYYLKLNKIFGLHCLI